MRRRVQQANLRILRREGARAKYLGLIACTGLFACGTAYADGFENIPTGSRTAAMGGAGIAGGSDSAMPTLNPAGLALIPGSIASVSASLYQYGIVRVPNFISDSDTLPTDLGDVTTSQKGVESKEFASFPSAAAYFLHLGSDDSPTILGASLSIPKSISRRFVQNTEYLGEGLSFKETVSHVVTEQTYAASISWASRFGSLRTGASIVGGYTEIVRTVDLNQLQVRGTAGFHRLEVKEADSLNSLDLGLLVGAQLDITSEIRVGATFRTPSAHLMGKTEGSVDTADLDSDGEPQLSTTLRSGSSVRGIPMRVGAGVEYHTDDWGVAIDVSAYLPRNAEYRVRVRQVRSDIGGGVATEDQTFGGDVENIIPTEMVLNAGLGFELKVTETNWLRGGLFTDFSSLQSSEDVLDDLNARRAVSSAGRLFSFPITRIGGSAGWGSRFGPVDTTFGLRVSYGSGSTLRIDPDRRFVFAQRLAGPVEELTDAQVFEGLAFLSAAIDLSEDASSLMEHMTSGGVER